MGCVDPVGEAGGDIARIGRDLRRLRRWRARRPDQPVLRFGPRCRQFRGGAGHVRPARHGDRRRRRVDEPRRHRCVRRRLAGRPGDRAAILFRAAGDFRRPDRDQIRLFARRRRCLCGGKPAARRAGLGGGPIRANRSIAGERPQRHHHPRQGRTYAAENHDAVAGAAQAVLRRDGRAWRLRRRRHPGPSGGRSGQPRPSRRQFVGHRRRRRRRADRERRGRAPRRTEAACAHQRVRQYRLRARDHADRAGRRDTEGAASEPA